MSTKYLFLGLLLSVSGTIVCMKRPVSPSCCSGDGAKRQQRESTSSVDSCDSIADPIDAMAERESVESVFVCESEHEGEGREASDSDSKEMSDSHVSAAAAMDVHAAGVLAIQEDEDFYEAPFTALELELHTLGIQEHNLGIIGEQLGKGADLIARDPESSGDTALHCAVRYNPEVVEFLIKAKARLEACNFDGLTPLLLAAQEVRMDTLELLINAGADYNYADPDTGETMLHKVASSECGTACLRKMVCEYGMDMRARDFNGRTPAMVALKNNKIGEGFYLARMKYNGQRVYNFFCKQADKRRGTWREVRAALGDGLVTPIPEVLFGGIISHLFCAKQVPSVEEVADEQDLDSDDCKDAAE